MPSYLLAYHGGTTPEGEEAQAKTMAAWNEWMESVADDLIDGGNPVGATRSLNADGSTGEAPEHRITGYSIIDADDMDEAIEMARTCPILADGGSIEIAELIDIEGMAFEEDEDDEDEDDEESEVAAAEGERA